jgi:ABC-type lipoprotein export system ATPase subunit
VPRPDPVLACRAVDVVYPTPTGEVDALVDVSAAFSPGALNVVAGPSGSGKSSLLRVLAALERPRTGEVLLDGEDIARASRRRRRVLRRHRIAYVGSHTRGALTPGSTIDDELRLAAAVRGAPDGWERVAGERLTAVGLGDHRSSHAVALSGGEQQRAAVVAALVGEPEVLLADEPTAALDSATALLLVAQLRAVAERGTTVVIASHDPAVIADADHVVNLRSGRVVR